MPVKTKPVSGQSSWGNVLNTHLEQLIPNSGGGINTFDIFTDRPIYKAGTSTLLNEDDVGLTYLFTQTGNLHRWNGTVWKVLNESLINVKDYGAIGDGVADDTLAINRTVKYVASLGGGVVFYPAGTYKITRSIRLDNFDIETNTYTGTARKNIVHLGDGMDCTIIKASGFYTSIFTSFPEPYIASAVPDIIGYGNTPANEFVFTAENTVIDGFTLDCDYNVNVDGGAAYGAYYEAWGGTWPNGTRTALHAADNYQYPVFAYNIRGLVVKNCRIKQSWFNGIEIYRCHDIQVFGNIIENCGDKANYLGHYCAIEFDNASYRGIFSENIVKNCGIGVVSNGDTLSYVWRAVSNIHIKNNIFDTLITGIFAFDWIAEWEISGNTFTSLSEGGILFALNATVVNGRHPSNCKITDNLINGFNISNKISQVAVRLAGHGHTCIGNTINQLNSEVTNQTSAIVASMVGLTLPSGHSESVVIANNTIVGYYPGTDQNSQIINCGTKAANITNNIINALGNTAQVAIGISADDAHVEGNSILGTYLYNSGKRSIYYASGLRPYVNDKIATAFLQINTTTGRSGLVGWNDVDFINYQPKTIDVRGNFNNGTGNAFVADIPGLYEFYGVARFNNVGSSGAQISVMASVERNGSATFDFGSGYSAGGIDIPLMGAVELNTGDYLKMRMYCSSTYTQGAYTNFRVKLIKQRS